MELERIVFAVLERVDGLPIEILEDKDRRPDGASRLSLERMEIKVELGVLACVHGVHSVRGPRPLTGTNTITVHAPCANFVARSPA